MDEENNQVELMIEGGIITFYKDEIASIEKEEGLLLKQPKKMVVPNQKQEEAKRYFNESVIYFKNKQYEEAIKFFKRALQPGPFNLGAYFFFEGAYVKLGKYEDTIIPRQKAINLKPNNPYAHFHLGKYKEAFSAYQKVLQLKQSIRPEALELAAIYSNLGDCSIGLGRYQEAIDFYHQGIRISPKHTNTYDNLASLYNKFRGKDKEAEECLMRVYAGTLAQEITRLLHSQPEVSKIYTGYIQCVEKDEEWYESVSPKLGDIKFVIDSKYTVLLGCIAMLSGTYLV